MPFYSSQDALAYIDTDTKACMFFHADSGNLSGFTPQNSFERDAIRIKPNPSSLD